MLNEKKTRDSCFWYMYLCFIIHSLQVRCGPGSFWAPPANIKPTSLTIELRCFSFSGWCCSGCSLQSTVFIGVPFDVINQGFHLDVILTLTKFHPASSWLLEQRGPTEIIYDERKEDTRLLLWYMYFCCSLYTHCAQSENQIFFQVSIINEQLVVLVSLKYLLYNAKTPIRKKKLN